MLYCSSKIAHPGGVPQDEGNSVIGSRSHRCLQTGQTLEQRPVQGHRPPQPLQLWLRTGTQKELQPRLQRRARAGRAGMGL